jgi:hypothetical protein
VKVVPAFDPGEGGRTQHGERRPRAALDQLQFVGSEPAFATAFSQHWAGRDRLWVMWLSCSRRRNSSERY